MIGPLRAISVAIALSFSIGVALPAKSQVASSPEPLSAEAIEKLNGAGASLLDWIKEEQKLNPKKIPQSTLCAKIANSIPAEPDVDNLPLTIQWVGPRGSEGQEPTEETALSPYALARALKEGCEFGGVHIYDPRGQPANEDQFQENYPACFNGPSLTIRHEDALALQIAIDAFDELKQLAFACIGARLPRNNPPSFNVRGKIDDVLLLNSRLDRFGVHNAKVDRLRVLGTVRPRSDDLHKFDDALESNRQVDLPQPSYPGTQLDSITMTSSEIGSLHIAGSAVRSVAIGSGQVKDGAIISRSDLGSVWIVGSKLKSLSISQVRIGFNRNPNDKSGETGLSVANNDIAEDLRLGNLDDRGGVLSSQVSETEFENEYGPHPPWSPGPDKAYIPLRGYLSLKQNRIEGRLIVQGIDLAGAGFGEPSTPDTAQDERRGAFVNLDNLSARSLTFAGNNLRFGPKTSGLAGGDIKIAEDVTFKNNIVHNRESDAIDPKTVNRLIAPIGKNVATITDSVSLINFMRLAARHVVFEQNLIIGAITLFDPTVQTLTIFTAPSDQALVSNGVIYCAKHPDKAELGNLGNLSGGAAIFQLREMPKDAIQFPPCYGSVLVRAGNLNGIVADGLLSDLFVIGAQIKHGITVGGRVSGVVNLANLQLKDGLVVLGEPGKPLRWCKDGQLLLDGIRLGAFQADTSVFYRLDCDVAPAKLDGPLKMSMRGARIDQIMGQPRLVSDLPSDAGLLGLSVDELIAIAAPPSPARGRTAEKGNKFDPQPLSLLSSRLRGAGFVPEASALSMERVSRQKWESDSALDRMKWLLGWPVGWGYQTEWAFIYALFFVLIGAWVSAYYREYPEISPPDDKKWLKQIVDKAAGTVSASRIRQAGIQVALTVTVVTVILLAALWLPDVLSLSQHQTLAAIGVLIVSLAAFHLRTVIQESQSSGWKNRALRFAVVARHLGYHSFFFSLDRFLPSPGFHAYWANYPTIGQAGRNYFYFHRLIGLVLISITAAGAAGLFE